MALGEKFPVVMEKDRSSPEGVAALDEAGKVPEEQLRGGSVETHNTDGKSHQDLRSAIAQYRILFTAGEWTAGDGEYTITVAKETHGLEGTVASCAAFALVGGVYLENVWCVLETYATVEENGDVTLHCSGGYEGQAVLRLY